MEYKAEILTSYIIVVGDFNPAIFSPEWLERNNLIGEGDAIVAREGSQDKQSLVSHQATTFESEWFALQVVGNQFLLKNKGVLSPAFKDLAVGIFQLLSHTPVKAVGLNFVGYFKLATLEEQHKIGDVFAPKDIWDTLYPETCAGLEQLIIRIQHGSREEGADTGDHKIIALQKSNDIKYGVRLSFNDHHNVTTSDDSDLTSAEKVAIIVEKGWMPVWDDAVRVFDRVLSMAMSK